VAAARNLRICRIETSTLLRVADDGDSDCAFTSWAARIAAVDEWLTSRWYSRH
jgi:hypothetical protein